jgi:hypothetical protein
MLKGIGTAKLQLPRVEVLFAGAVALLFTTETGTVLAMAQTVQKPGTLVEFLIPERAMIDKYEPRGGIGRADESRVEETVAIDPGKELVVTAVGSTKREVGDCGSGSFPAQNANLIDLNGGAPIRLVASFIPLGEARFPTGTRLGSITGGALCGPGYRRYKGTVK